MSILDEFIGLKAGARSGDMARKKSLYFRNKRGLDLFACVLIMPWLIVSCVCLLILNPFFNNGPLLFRQKRMGWRCEPFMIYKFRTMSSGDGMTRSANDPLEVSRITPLGAILRSLRIDEIPQIINILKGEMTLIGPRPDCFEHAQTYRQTIFRYAQRHNVRPGITGLAQTEIGYVQSIRETRRKVSADLYYIQNASLRFDAWIAWRTVIVLVSRAGT